MPIPIAISVPHAGLLVPDWLRGKCRLSVAEIIQDGDEEAADIYAMEDEFAALVTTQIARAVVDLNRPEDDRRKDGVIKTHTCYDIPIWREPLTPREEQRLLDEHYRPYHERLADLSARKGLLLAVDCHTMAAVGPPVAPDPGRERPWVCLGDVYGTTLPKDWMAKIADCFRRNFGAANVAINQPFAGGYITQTHGRQMPWLQLELARGLWMTSDEKRRRVVGALSNFVEQVS